MNENMDLELLSCVNVGRTYPPFLPWAAFPRLISSWVLAHADAVAAMSSADLLVAAGKTVQTVHASIQ